MEVLLDDNLNNLQKLKAIMAEPLLCNTYEEYLKKTFAWENFGFCYEVQKFKRADTQQLKQEMANNIFNYYLTDDAVFKIGIVSDEEVEKIEQSLDHIEDKAFDKLQLDAFVELANSTINEFIEHQLFVEFQNHFSKFGNSKCYPQGKKSKMHLHLFA